MFGTIGAFYSVVGTHHSPGLGILDCKLVAGQVDFTQGAIIDNGVYHPATEFLVVDSILLQRGTHSLALHTIDLALGRFTGQVGVFGKYSKLRPHNGERLIFTPEPKITPTFSSRLSSPSATPT